MKTTRPDLIDIEYETFGSATDPAMLLVAGFVVQLTSWDTQFCELPRRRRSLRHSLRQS